MKLALEPGDVVEVDHKGRRFLAPVEAIEGQGLQIKPIERHYTWRTARAHEVIGIWRASKATRARRGVRAASTELPDEPGPRLFA